MKKTVLTSSFGNFDSRCYEQLGAKKEPIFMQHGAVAFVMWSNARGFSLHQSQVVIFMGQAVLLWAGCCCKGYVGNDVSARCNPGDSHEASFRLHKPLLNAPRGADDCLRGKESQGQGRPAGSGSNRRNSLLIIPMVRASEAGELY